MASLNKAMLIGNLGKEAETKFTSVSNIEMTTFSIATSFGRKDKDGKWTDETTWHFIKAFALSDYVKSGLKKGAKVYVEGRMTNREYEQNGIKKNFHEIVAERVLLMDSKGQSGNDYSTGSGREVESINNQAASTDDNDLPF